MKKILSVFVVLLIAGCVFAVNVQKIYPVDSEIYTTIKSIYIMTGHSLPSTTGPWSAAELLQMLEKISANEVPSSLKDAYDAALAELAEEPEHQWKGIGATFSNELNLQLGFHTNTDSQYTRTTTYGRNEGSSNSETWTEQLFIGRDNWSSDYLHEIEPLYRLNWETWVSDIAYSYFEFGLFNSYHGDADNDYGVKNLSTNIFLFQNLAFEPGFMDANFPYRAFISAGGDSWSIQVGRDRLSWGAGTTGNLAMSDNFLYHDMARLTAFSDKYKYTFLTTFYPHPQNYYYWNADGSAHAMNYTSGQNGLDGISMYIAHRIEGRFIKDRLGLTLTEAIMYESKNNHLDLAVISPVFIFHNQYTPDVANSTLTLEADFTPFNGLNIYGQLLVDEFAIPLIEESASATNSDTPNRYGFLAGVTYVTAVADGVLTANAEYAQIDPYTYLRRNCYNSEEENNYGLDYVVATRLWSTAASGITYDEKVLGYTYGPDCRVINANVDYRTGKLDVSVNFLSMNHGTHDQWTKAPGSIGGAGEENWTQCCTTCTTKHESGNWRYSDASSRNAVIRLMDIGVSASYQLLDCLKVYGQFDYVSIKNAYNIEGQDDSDIQIVAGLKYTF